MRILILNQYVPPDEAPTARCAGQLAAEFEREGHEVVFVGCDAMYGRRVHRGAMRLVGELKALAFLGWRAFRTPKIDRIVSLSSPPLLGWVAGTVARLRGIPHFHWIMDLYPDIAVSLGVLGKGSPLERLFTRLMRSAYRRAALIWVVDSDMQARLRSHYGVGSAVRIPEPVRIPEVLPAVPPGEDWTWLYSGNLGRAHEWKTLLEVQARLEKKGLPVTLVFQGGGPSWKLAQKKAETMGLARCRWLPYAPKEDLVASLLSARVLVASQNPETLGQLSPSKMSLLEKLPRPILWVGPVESATVARLRERGNAGWFERGDGEGVEQWLLAQIKS
jgi:glycosyltransferase involved in cell wall biosynthesis